MRYSEINEEDCAVTVYRGELEDVINVSDFAPIHLLGRDVRPRGL